MRTCIIVPTKDRREDLKLLLASMAAQTRPFDQVVLVDGGDDTVEDLVAAYPAVPIDYLRVYPPGFTKQKNAGRAAVRDDMDLIGYLDDDIVLEPDAVERLLAFWESHGPELGGTQFHVTDQSVAPATFSRRFFGTASRRQGALLRSGTNTVVWPVERDARTEWLSGGATVWRRGVIEGVEHDETFAGYGHMDDVDFSLRVGDRWEMWVVADARLEHHERPIALEREYAFGVYDTVMRYVLVRKYPRRFSRLAWCWATFGKYLGRAVAGLRGSAAGRLRARGYLHGWLKALRGDLSLVETRMK